MKAGAHPALAQGKVRYVGDHVAVVIADTYAQARDAAEKIEVALWRVARRRRSRRRPPRSGQPQIHDVAPNNTVFNWHIGDKARDRRGIRLGEARDQARPRQQPY